MRQDLGTLPTTTETRDMSVWVPGNLWDPIGHFETMAVEVHTVDLSHSAPLAPGDTLSFSCDLLA